MTKFKLTKGPVAVVFNMVDTDAATIYRFDHGEYDHGRRTSLAEARNVWRALVQQGFKRAYRHPHAFQPMAASCINVNRGRKIDTYGAKEVTREELWNMRHRRPSKLKATIMEILHK